MPMEVRGALLSTEFPGAPESAIRERIAGTYDRLKPGPGLSPQVVASHQRMRIQLAMAQLVAGGGRRMVTIRKLTKLAGVSTATFYSHFDGTDECLLATYETLMTAIRERIASTRAPSAGRRTQSDLAIKALLDALVEDPEAGRLTLIEVIDAGPAAIGPMRTHETLLEASMREVLNRRGMRIAPSTVAWVVAGLLHCARQLLDPRTASVRPEETRSLLRWGRLCLNEPKVTEPVAAAHTSDGLAEDVLERARSGRGDEQELILNAVLKVACAKGYWKLTVGEASKLAGVPATHFKRHFKSLDEAYLLAVDRAARGFFAGFGSPAVKVARGEWEQALRDQLAALSISLASDPDTAGVVFAGILAPGAAGLTRREALIDELAMTWAAAIPEGSRPPDFVVKASMASLWGALARAAEMGRTKDLPAEVATNAQLFLAPMLTANRRRERMLAAPIAIGSAD